METLLLAEQGEEDKSLCYGALSLVLGLVAGFGGAYIARNLRKARAWKAKSQSSGDHGRRKNLMQEILNILHDQHRVRGVTVFRGIAGFGNTGEVHAADILRLMVDLPLVIEFFDKPTVVQAVLGLLNGLSRPMLAGGGRTLEALRVLRHDEGLRLLLLLRRK